MNKFFQFSKPLILLFTLGLFVASCSDDQEDPVNEEELTQTELRTIVETDAIAASADTILADLYSTGINPSGRNATECYEVTYTETGYTAVFNNCVLNGTDNANGTVTVVYSTEPGTAAFTATYVDFYVGNVKLNGTRSFTLIADPNQSSISFSVSSDMTAEFSDGEVISESGSREFTFTFGDSLETSTYALTGSWELEVGENVYTVNITSALSGNLGCAYLTSGSMTVNKNGLEVGVDFGDGSCDDIATIIYPNGATEEVTLGD